MTKYLCAFLFVLIHAGPLLAKPDLGHYRDVAGVRIYRDHKRADTWYLTPASPRLSLREDQSPAYSLDLFRYYGRQATGDKDFFWAHGVLSLTLSRQRPPQQVKRIRRDLQASGIKYPKLRSMPIAGADIRLLYAGQSLQWQQGSRWSGGTFTLPLDAEAAQLLWQAVELGQLQVSLVVEEQLSGVRRGDSPDPTWQEKSVANGWTLPVDLDRKRYSDKFQRTDLSGRMAHGYTGLNVFCFDFLENLVPGLYAKSVEVAIPTEGRDLIVTVTFRESGDYRARIDFELARDLDQPYRVRITEIFRDGRRQVGPWQLKQGDSLLDITAYRDESGQEPSTVQTEEKQAEYIQQEDLNNGI